MTIEYDEQAARAAHEKLRADMTPKPVFPSPPRSKQSLLDDAAALLIAKGYRKIDGPLQEALGLIADFDYRRCHLISTDGPFVEAITRIQALLSTIK